MNFRHHRKAFSYLLLCLLLFLSLLGAYILNAYGFLIPKDDPSEVAFAFASALATNNARITKAVTDESLWPRLEYWIEHHQEWVDSQVAVGCPVSVEESSEHVDAIDYLPAMGPISGTIGQGLILRYEAHFATYCSEGQRWYCFDVNDIVTAKRGEIWVVIDWGGFGYRLDRNGC